MRKVIRFTTLCVCFSGLLAACGGEGGTPDSSPTSTALKLQTIASNLTSPVFLTAPRGDNEYESQAL